MLLLIFCFQEKLAASKKLLNEAAEDANSEYVNPQGVRFTPQEDTKEG